VFDCFQVYNNLNSNVKFKFWQRYGGLPKYANQGTEASNFFHNEINSVMGCKNLKTSVPGVDVAMYLVRYIIFTYLPTRKQELETFIKTKYKNRKK
jgi:hypothetical protein